MDEPEPPVFTFIEGDEPIEEQCEDDPENNIIYLTFNEDNSNESDPKDSLSYLIPKDGTSSDILNSDLKIVTVGDEQYVYYIPNEEDSVEDQLGSEVAETVLDEDTTITEPTVCDEDSDPQDPKTIINLLEPYKMIMVNDAPLKLNIIEKTKKFKCLYKGCEKFYSTSQHLTVHMRNHSNSKPFPCSYKGCDKKFATNYSLTAHRRTHTGEKPYTCQVCSKSFKASGDLMKHTRIHTGEKPFVCPVEGCGKSFTTSNIRKVHVRSHTGERPYVCDYPNCGKAFASSTNYKNHARIHSGEKPYVCSVPGCGKKFTEYSSLYKHQFVHRIVEKLFECYLCKQKFKSENTLNVHRKVKHGVVVSADKIHVLDLESIQLASLNS